MKAALVAPVVEPSDSDPMANPVPCFDACSTMLTAEPLTLAADKHWRCEECLDERLGVERREKWEADRDEAGDRAFEGRRDEGRV